MKGGNGFSSYMNEEEDHHDSNTTKPLIPSDTSNARNSNSSKLNSLQRLYQLSRPEHKTLVLSALLMALASGVQLCTPALTGQIIDSALRSSSSSNNKDTEQDKAGDNNNTTTTWLLFQLLGLLTVAAALTFVRRTLEAHAGHTFTCRLQQQTYARLLCQDRAFFDQVKLGDLLSRLSSDAEPIHHALTSHSLSMLRSTCMATGAIALLLNTSWTLALLAVCILPPTLLVSRHMGRYTKRQHQRVQERHAQATSLAEQALTLQPTVQQFNAEVHETIQYSCAVQEAHEQSIQTARLQAMTSGFVQLCSNASMMAVLGYGAHLIQTGVLSPGQLSGFAMYSVIMAGNVNSLSGNYVDLMKSLAALDRVLAVLDREPELPAPNSLLDFSETRTLGKTPGGQRQPSHKQRLLQLQDDDESTMLIPKDLPLNGDNTMIVRPMSVTFENVTFSYPSRPNITVLQNLNLSIRQGQVLALVGGSGSGKSTVAALLTKLYQPSSGQILMDNRADWTPQQVRAAVGIVNQEPLLFPTSIADNIRYGKRHATDDEIEHAAEQAQVMDFAKSMPDGLQTVVGPRGTQLSGGQKQRVAIARCLLKNPSIVILDEATSALDAESEHAVQLALEKASHGRTVLLIAHRLSSIRHQAHQIAVLQGGHVVEQGTFEELTNPQTNPNGAFRQLVERQLLQE